MKRKHKALFITIVPSPYQRDLFGALAARDDVDLSVYYMEATSPDSPWPEQPLRPFEQIMPGFWVPFGDARCHVNWRLPELSGEEVVVISSYTSLTGQWLMRQRLRGTCWLFWGERLRHNTGLKERLQRVLTAPLAQGSGIVSIGSQAQAEYRRRFPHLPHFCIPYHCDLSAFFAIPRRVRSNSQVTFLYCGQMIRRKGVDLLLIAFDAIIANGIDAQLLLVGREADLPEFLTTVGPATRDRIRYAGFQAPQDLPEFYSQSDVFVLPSRQDGWGVVVNQALAAGLPVVTSDAVGAGNDLVEHGVNGLHVAAGDVEQLRLAMETLALDRTLTQKWGENSRGKAIYTGADAGAEKWVRVFEDLKNMQSMTNRLAR